MHKKALTWLLGCLSAPLWGDVIPAPHGYYYGNMTAPTGMEWQSPDSLSYNKERPHAWFFSFADMESARKVLPEASAYWRSLDGEWDFHWAPTLTTVQKISTKPITTLTNGTKCKCLCAGT